MCGYILRDCVWLQGGEDYQFVKAFGAKGSFGAEGTLKWTDMPEDGELGDAVEKERPWRWRAAVAAPDLVSNFLHPVLRVWRREGEQERTLLGVHHVMEDLDTRWDLEETFIAPVREFLEKVAAPEIAKQGGGAGGAGTCAGGN